MFIESFSVNDFRNLNNVTIQPDRHLNIITGNNAQGKTNLIEAIYIFTGCKSFRNSKESEYINLKKQSAEVEIMFNNSQRSQKIHCNLSRSRGKEKCFSLNGVDLKGSSALFEQFKCIVFMPDDIELIKGSPEKRRSFIDLCYCQIQPSALNKLRRLELITAHRNALLKSISIGRDVSSSLVPWNVQLAEVGSYISYMRYKYTCMLSKKATQLYYEISGNSESLSVEYQSNIFNEDDFKNGFNKGLAKKYLDALNKRTNEDIKAGYTLSGTPRDDIIFKIDGLNIKPFGSQGQKKSTAIVMKLAQADIYSKKTNETPIVLLDDVMGELDAQRQKYVCSILGDTQVFVTVCNEELFIKHSDAKVFMVNNGKVSQKGSF
ncbi:MAG: DNA replication/repair protein RecF [Ruminococcus sp.]|nr:DNA replication/repair protein RecF [Ruminococcus sp.]